MDGSKTFIHENPRETANLPAVLLWTWTLKLFQTGYGKILERSDLYDPLKSDRSDVLGDRLEREWKRELDRCKQQKQNPSLLRAILRCFWWEYFQLGLLQLWTEFVLRLGTPVLIAGLLHYFEDDSAGAFGSAVMYAAGICAAIGLTAIATGQELYGGFHNGGKIRIAVCSLIYRKALRLSLTALGETSPGKVINLVANDVNRFDVVSLMIHYMWSAPIMTLIVGYFLYTEAGYAGLFGIVVVLVVVPIQSYTGKLSSIFRLQTALKTDERVGVMNEIISGVRVIKMYAWERPFCAMVELARKLELKVVRKTSYVRGLYMTLNLFTPRMAIYSTTVGMLFFGEPLSAEKVFLFSSYFNVLAFSMSLFVRGIAEVAECRVAVRRLQFFLMHEELQALKNCAASEIPTSKEAQQGCTTVISLENLTAKWEHNSQDNTLEAVSVDIERGKLYMVIGAVGTGKSSLMSAILGEMWNTAGRIDVKGKISYASQEPWVFGSTVRQNILFGQPHDHQRYQRVTKACALLSDFKQLPHGDQTVVGERGISLSGGQNARVNLARSVYRQADIYVFDDPLSAVDAHVGRHLFEECIQKYLAGKTRILATHQLQYIREVDEILLLEHGKLTKFANYVELSAERTEYADLFASGLASEAVHHFHARGRISTKRQSTSSTRSLSLPFLGDGLHDEPSNADQKTTTNLENTSKGVVKGSIYRKYFRTGGSWCLIATVSIFFLLAQFMATLNDLYLKMLVDAEEKRYDQYLEDIGNVTHNSTYFYGHPTESAHGYVYVYTAIVLLIFVIGLARSFLFYALTLGVSQRLHDRAFGALIRTGMRFFDKNPSGRILNRFSKDLAAIDELLPKALLDAGQVIMMTGGAFVVVCLVHPVFLAVVAILSFVCYWVRRVYLRTSKNVKRLEAVLRAPVFTHLNATLDGLSTIRAYGAQEILKSEFDRYQDTHSSAWYMFIAAATAFSFSMDVLCFSFITIVTFSLLFVSGYSKSEIGVSITTIIGLVGILQWGMRQSAEVENQMMSVERVMEYTLLSPEDSSYNNNPAKNEQKAKMERINNESKEFQSKLTDLSTVPKDWPSAGCIKFYSVSMRYEDNEDAVLRGLDFTIQPREKIGIVGRTGAGKSSLISALFRMAKLKGIIEIDGVDTGSIRLEDLRRHISIIPQDPVLFSGTLRKNLDPFGEFSDDDLWTVLEEVELKDTVVNDIAGLESRVFDRGTNYSIGERQLACLARAILRNNKILMLDEATANVDPHTDTLIQKTIRTKFADCTVLTVAHRLNTIMDSDRVLVMDRGQLVEFDHPHLLLQNDSGQFSSLVRETGRAMHNQLSKVAEESYLQKYGERL